MPDNQYRLVIDFVADELDREDLIDAVNRFIKLQCKDLRVIQTNIFPPYYSCTNCDFEFLEELPYYSYEICDKCGVEFGVDDPYAGKDKETFMKDYHRK